MTGPPGTAGAPHHLFDVAARLGRLRLSRHLGWGAAAHRLTAGVRLVHAQPAAEPQLRALDRVLLQLVAHDRADRHDHRHQRHRRAAGDLRRQRGHDPVRARCRRSTRTPGKPSWLPFWFGSFAGIIPWMIVAIYVWAPGLCSGRRPAFVYGDHRHAVRLLQLSSPSTWCCSTSRSAPGATTSFGEKVYIILSLTAKALLAWQVFFPVLTLKK